MDQFNGICISWIIENIAISGFKPLKELLLSRQTMIARGVMNTVFHCIRPDNTIAEAVRLLKTASDAEGKNIFGMMVTDGKDRLVGMLVRECPSLNIAAF